MYLSRSMIFFIVVLLLIDIGLRITLYQYIKRIFRQRNQKTPVLWLLAVILLPLLLSFLLFLVIGRKPRLKMCSHCGYFNQGLAQYCENCGGTLPEEAPFVEDDEEILFIVLLGVVFLVAPILFILLLNILILAK